MFNWRSFLYRARFIFRACGVVLRFFWCYLSKSGARGLIKAPAGSGAGPGRRPPVIGTHFMGLLFPPPPLVGGGLGGGFVGPLAQVHKLLLDLLVLTDTCGVCLGVYGVR